MVATGSVGVAWAMVSLRARVGGKVLSATAGARRRLAATLCRHSLPLPAGSSTHKSASHTGPRSGCSLVGGRLRGVLRQHCVAPSGRLLPGLCSRRHALVSAAPCLLLTSAACQAVCTGCRTTPAAAAPCPLLQVCASPTLDVPAEPRGRLLMQPPCADAAALHPARLSTCRMPPCCPLQRGFQRDPRQEEQRVLCGGWLLGWVDSLAGLRRLATLLAV